MIYKMEDQLIQSNPSWFKKGHLDLVMPEARKRASVKISLKLKGKHNSLKTEYKNGEEHPFWKGGITPKSQKERNRFRYKSSRWKEIILERDESSCQLCGQSGGRLEVHHIHSWILYPQWRFETENGLTLCHKCHKQTDNYGRYSNHS